MGGGGAGGMSVVAMEEEQSESHPASVSRYCHADLKPIKEDPWTVPSPHCYFSTPILPFPLSAVLIGGR